MKLSNKTAGEIASLVNSVNVGQIIINSAIQEGNEASACKDWDALGLANAKAKRWQFNQARDVVALAERYGIELPWLAQARRDVEEEKREKIAA